jgi:hypothetical protein
MHLSGSAATAQSLPMFDPPVTAETAVECVAGVDLVA